MNAPDSILGRTLVGVDGSDAAFEACRQAGWFADPAAIDVLAVVHVGPDVAAALDAARIADVLRRSAEVSLERAVSILGPQCRTRYADGFVAPVLLDEIDRIGAGLVALGSHGHRRATEILLGGVAGELLHDARCSVLLVRPSTAGPSPRTLLVGHDGSDHAELALAAARLLAERHGADLRVVTALRGKHVDRERVRASAPSVEAIDAHPVAALVGEAANADLLVVGSRGLHGLRALGSVSERVAHRAPCSVLVVRGGGDGASEAG